jgi:hypothetical protein
VNTNPKLEDMLADGLAAINWAATDEARTRFRAAWDVAQRIGSRVTQAELTAMLWAAQKAAAPISATQPKEDRP